MLATNHDYQVRVYISNGVVTHFTLREMNALYRSWQMWVLIAVGFFIMTTGHPVTWPQFDSIGERMAFWVLALMIYMLTSDVYSQAFDTVWQRAVGKPIPLILLSAPLVLSATYMSAFAVSLLSTDDEPFFGLMTWQMNLRNIIVVHVFETVALLWLIPAQRQKRQSRTERRTVTLAGRSFVLEEITRVKAAEHFLEVYSDKGCEVIRERMSTFLEQVKPEDGIQTHRSHWVAGFAADGLSGALLDLRCGAQVPVARGRLADVRDWLDAHADKAGEPA
ncbi:MAG: LytTR family DNA-binding domain-containing protein [Pseudomonadota bacterium]